jgi:hypothetical protein
MDDAHETETYGAQVAAFEAEARRLLTPEPLPPLIDCIEQARTLLMHRAVMSDSRTVRRGALAVSKGLAFVGLTWCFISVILQEEETPPRAKRDAVFPSEAL